MKKKTLVLCTGNSCRSQMAEGFLRYYKGDKYDVFSAGTNPTKINPYAVKIMEEIGIDISNQIPQSVDKFLSSDLDIVITVCDNAEKTCPSLNITAQKLHWPFEDPADVKGSEEEILNVFRRIRDEIKEKIINEL